MKLNAMIEGLGILRLYYDTGERSCAEQGVDALYFDPTDHAMASEDVARMIELGWVQEGSSPGGEHKPYDPGKSWVMS